MKNLETKKTPKLRFAGFSDEWQENRLGDILKIGSGRDYKYLEKGDIPVYGTGGLMLYVNAYLYNGKSICIGRKGTIDKPQFLKGKFWTVDTLFYTYDYKNSIPEFLYSIFQKVNWQKYSEASGVPSLSKTTIEKIKVNIPAQKEQEKIAGFLGVVDDKISALQNKKELLVKYKKGLMQKIFPTSHKGFEGQAPEIRFKDENGKDYPDWQEKKLGEMYAFIRTNSLSRALLEVADNGIKNIHYGDIHTKLPIQLDADRYPLPRIKDKSVIFDKHDFCKTGDVVVADASEDYADIGKCIEIRNAVVGQVVAGLHTHLLRPIEEVASGFGGYIMRSTNFRKQITRIATGVSVLGISKSNLSKSLMPIPSVLEQQKIADFLTSIDEKIKAEERKLEQAKQFKKSLLQQMFV